MVADCWAISATVRHLFCDSFVFVAKGVMMEGDIAESESAAHSAEVQERLSVTECTQELVLSESGMEASEIRSLQCFVSERRSHSSLERLLLSGSRTGIRATQWDCPMEIFIDLESADLLGFSVKVKVSVGSLDNRGASKLGF
jgi:hypothetical protein